MPSKTYITVTIALVALAPVVTAQLAGCAKNREADAELASAVRMQCDGWARELDKAAEAYEAFARNPAGVDVQMDLPFGSTHHERSLAGGRIINEQKFCRFVRKREGTDMGVNEVDDAGALFASTGDDAGKLAKAVRRLAEAAKKDATLAIGP